MKYLDIGCGNSMERPTAHNVVNVFNAKPEEFTGMDFYYKAKNVVNHDLLNFPYPFEDNTFDGVLMCHVFEHFQPYDGIKIIEECHRILKPTGDLVIYCPHFTTGSVMTHLTHQREVGWRTFDSFTDPNEWERYSDKRFEMLERKLIFNPWKKFTLIPFIASSNPNFFERIWSKYTFGVDEIYFKMRPIKS